MAKDSNIEEIHGSTALKKILQEHMGVYEEENGYPQKEIFKMSIAAIVSLFFITGMWFSFSKGLDTLITLEIPAEYTKRDPQVRNCRCICPYRPS